MARFKAKLTSKNQLTLPAGISAMLHARPGDVVTFNVDEKTGEIKVSGADMEGLLREWAGRWATEDQVVDVGDTDRWIRDLRGERE